MDDASEPKKKNLFGTAVNSFTSALGSVMVAEAISGNKGIRDILKSKVSLSIASAFTVLEVARTAYQNRKVDSHVKRIEQEQTASGTETSNLR